jgi:hypothetical protein
MDDYQLYKFESQTFMRNTLTQNKTIIASAGSETTTNSTIKKPSDKDFRWAIANKFVLEFKETFGLDLCWLRSQTLIKDQRLLDCGIENKEERVGVEKEAPGRNKKRMKRQDQGDDNKEENKEENDNNNEDTYSKKDGDEKTEEEKKIAQTTTDGKRMSPKNTFLPPCLFHVGCSMPLYCSTCLARDKLELVCVCKFNLAEETVLGQSKMTVSQVFYHDSCLDKKSQSDYLHNGFLLLKFPLEKIVGDTYDKAIQKIHKCPTPLCFFDSEIIEQSPLYKRLQRNIESARGRRPLTNDDKQKAITLQPPGDLINIGDPSFDFDNRAYALQPSTQDEYEVEKKKHLRLVTRLGYYLSTNLAMVKDFAPFIFCHSKMREKRLSGSKSLKDLCKDNKEHHLFLNDVSLLFGGSEFRVCGNEPIHQPCHGDSAGGNVSLKGNDSLKSLVPNGSMIIPLVRQRQIYIKDPKEKILRSVTGQTIIFRGDLPHGGLTRRDNNWDVAIHCHFDSTYHPRVQGRVSMKEGAYLPIQHMKMVDHPVFFREFEETMRKFDFMAVEAYRRRGALQEAASKKGGSDEISHGMAALLLKRLMDMGTTVAWRLCGDIKEAGGAEENEVEKASLLATGEVNNLDEHSEERNEEGEVIDKAIDKTGEDKAEKNETKSGTKAAKKKKSEPVKKKKKESTKKEQTKKEQTKMTKSITRKRKHPDKIETIEK